ncbi:hypothetical protein AB0M36_30420 [Actinoplanes sp. NPDC051346]|uniref:hypothetical protein n=1 Tax=Actinoplanes sp. NPDC051346 TaxID=3155048 RepID=UPI00341C4C49
MTNTPLGNDPWQQPFPPQQPVAPPAHGQPVYGQPVYGQPFPIPVAAPPPRRLNTTLIVVVSVVLTVITCLAVSVVFSLIREGDDTDDALPEKVTSPTVIAARVSITEPATLGGLPKLRNENTDKVNETMTRALGGFENATNMFSAIYGSADPGKDLVLAAAVQMTVSDPEQEIITAFEKLPPSPVTNLLSADTGTLGGVAKCGTTTLSDIRSALCIWVDEGSLGMITWRQRSAFTVVEKFPELRAEIEARSR